MALPRWSTADLLSGLRLAAAPALPMMATRPRVFLAVAAVCAASDALDGPARAAAFVVAAVAAVEELWIVSTVPRRPDVDAPGVLGSVASRLVGCRETRRQLRPPSAGRSGSMYLDIKINLTGADGRGSGAEQRRSRRERGHVPGQG